MAAIDFPAGLPCPQRRGYDLQHVSPLMRSELASGRARQRRRYTSVPTIASVSWVMTNGQAQLFEAWFRWTLSDGSEWFNTKLMTPLGYQDYECRFVDIYEGPERFARDMWRFSAEVEIVERQTVDKDLLDILPDYVLYSDIFDRAMNQEWPQ